MKYIIIQKISAKVPILSSEIDYSIDFGRFHIDFNPCFEAMCIYICYGTGRKYGLAELLRNNYNDISSSEIDKFVGTFIRTHGTIKVKYDINDIETLSSPEQDFIINSEMIAYPISLSYNDEKQLLDIVKKPSNSVSQEIKSWWAAYCERYVIHAKKEKDIGYEVEELTNIFCNTHGFDIDWLNTWYRNNLYKLLPKKDWLKTKARNFIFWLKLILIIFVYIMIAVGIIAIGSDIDNFILSGIVMTIGFGMIAVPLALIFGKR